MHLWGKNLIPKKDGAHNRLMWKLAHCLASETIPETRLGKPNSYEGKSPAISRRSMLLKYDNFARWMKHACLIQKKGANFASNGTDRGPNFFVDWEHHPPKKNLEQTQAWQFFVTFFWDDEVTRNQRLSDLQLRDQKIKLNHLNLRMSLEQWKKPWLVGLYRGIYYPAIYKVYNKPL